MSAVKMTRTYAFVQLYHGDLDPFLLENEHSVPFIFVIVKHVLRNNHYRSTVLVFTPEITATLKVSSATTRVILATNKLVSATDKVI